MNSEVYLIDGSAYIYRAYHAITPLTTSQGLPTHAVFGFFNILRRILREKNPLYLAVAYDSRGPVFRHEMYTAYKANRSVMPEDLQVQIPYIKDLVRAFNICSFEIPGVEADDIIASAARQLSRQGHKVIVVSGDKDLLQLVGEQITVWEPMLDRVMDSQAVHDKYTVGPDQLLDCFALIGDSSDNIPGVPGIGPKTAGILINQYGTLEGIYTHLDGMKKSKMKERLGENREAVFLSRDLIRLKEDLDLPINLEAYRLPSPDDDQLQDLYKKLEFTSLIEEKKKGERIATDGFSLVQSEEQLVKLVQDLSEASLLVIDTETTSICTRTAKLVGISICVDLEKAWYIPLSHQDGERKRLSGQLDLALVTERLRPFLEDMDLPKLGHNIKYDYSVIRQNLGIRLGGPLIDTMIAAYLVEPTRRSYKLDDLCLDIGLMLTSFTEVVQGDSREDAFVFVEISAAKDYSCEDVYGALRLWQTCEPVLQTLELHTLFFDVEIPLIPILAEMELAGICVSMQVLDELSVEFKGKLLLLEQEIYQLAGREFNIQSPKQLGEILFDELHLPSGRKTKTGYSTDMKVLEKLAVSHELPARIMNYRNLAKLQSTYVEKLRDLIDAETGRVHTSYNQTVTATGRLSSSNPNLQNIPIRSEEGNRIRGAFVPAEGLVFLSADYSQIDLRVLAHYSQDPVLLQAFKSGGDIHARTAAQLFSISPMLLTPEMRRVAKTINFGIVYGMSSFGLASQLNISRKEAQAFIDRYFQLYSGVKTFMVDIVEKARADGFVTTLLHRRRILPEINAKKKADREFAERTAINTPIQGTAADIMKLAMIQVSEVLAKERLGARLLLQIHDELVFELPAAEIEETIRIVRPAMEDVLALDVPLVVNFERGKSLAKP
ncbi:MAG: DNA polymerase I [Proteobacteria bacterium]|nr:DNA polymerase I [Desulfocapsa sp.]MBU3943767.1 DNA polymerase I [Pseudomonadota bacterium]MCG2742659.1 DNA polymerase I [Desulfobacteraceae bacterium]MBU4029110.1 DNA polymerase I [Pseudomonadota bacterium]MBU4041797.1 DNA polymerase I [Pseudomonadota bacterium]